MNAKVKNVIAGNKVFAWLALATGVLLLVPLTIQWVAGTGIDGQGFNWRLSDFIVMGALIVAAGFMFVLA